MEQSVLPKRVICEQRSELSARASQVKNSGDKTFQAMENVSAPREEGALFCDWRGDSKAGNW